MMTREAGIGKGMDSPGFQSRYGQEVYCAFPNAQAGSGVHPVPDSLSTVVLSQR